MGKKKKDKKITSWKPPNIVCKREEWNIEEEVSVFKAQYTHIWNNHSEISS
jgi:hypothetical protein